MRSSPSQYKKKKIWTRVCVSPGAVGVRGVSVHVVVVQAVQPLPRLHERKLPTESNFLSLRPPVDVAADAPVQAGAASRPVELESPVLLSLLPLPPDLGGDDPQSCLLAVGQHLSGLPPLVVGGVGHVEDVTVEEGQAATRKTVVPGGVVVEERPHVQGPLGTGPDQRAGHGLLNFVESSLVAVVVLRSVLDPELDVLAGGSFQCLGGPVVSGSGDVDLVDTQDLVPAPQLSAHVRRTACQDEADEDSLGILAAHYVESQSGAALAQGDLPGLPGKESVLESPSGGGAVVGRAAQRVDGGAVSSHVWSRERSLAV